MGGGGRLGWGWGEERWEVERRCSGGGTGICIGGGGRMISELRLSLALST